MADMQSVDVPLNFHGTATILVPANLDADDARLLAHKLAMARILATFENPDAPEEQALYEYIDECSDSARATADSDWDAAIAYDNDNGNAVYGNWDDNPNFLKNLGGLP